MNLQDFLGQPAPTPERKLSGWAKYRGVMRLLVLASGSCLATFVARLLPSLAPVVGIGFAGGALALLAWATLTSGDQRLEISLVTISAVCGGAIALIDAVELLTLTGAKHWMALAAICVIGLAVYLSEGSHGRKN